MKVYRELRNTQEKLLEAERISSFSQTKIALLHEINNPLQFILPNIQILLKKIKEGKRLDKKLTEKCLTHAEEGTNRIREIMRKLDAMKEPKTTEYLNGEKMIDVHGESSDKNKEK